jgi:HD-like signal output (HDOD) protein
MEFLRLFKRPETAESVRPGRRVVSAVASRTQVDPAKAAGLPLVPPAALPADLAAFRPIRGEQLDASRRQALVKMFQNIPRPPRLLHVLLAPDFVSHASTSELSDLIAGEPVLAVQLLRTINSPLFSLRSPVASIEQATTLLGLTAVRSLCLRYLLAHSFKPDCEERAQVLEETWQASALATEICSRLSRALGYPDAGSLVSLAVLTFIGRLATATAMPKAMLSQVPSRDLLARSSAEQVLFALTAAEIGRLLMAQWGLPPAICDEAAEVDAVLFAPYAAWEPARASRLALCYLSSRLGERLAASPSWRLESFDLWTDPEPELHHVRAYLEHPAFAGVVTQLKEASFIQALEQQRLALREGA